MKLRVQYMAQLQDAVGRVEDVVELSPGSSLADLMSSLASSLGRETAAHLVTPEGSVRPSLMVVVNDAVVSAHHAGETLLGEGDEVVLLPPIAGG